MLSIISLFLAVIFFGMYMLFKRKSDKDFSFSNTFPFECHRISADLKASIVTIALFSVCSVIFYIDSYANSFKTSYFLIASISATLICILFILLNLITLVGARKHFFVFSLFASLITMQSIVLGFSSIDLFKISGEKILFIVVAVLFFVKALFELLLISPIFKFSFLLDVNEEDQTVKKPKFIRLAFYEWIYLFLFIGNTILLLVLKMI